MCRPLLLVPFVLLPLLAGCNRRPVAGPTDQSQPNTPTLKEPDAPPPSAPTPPAPPPSVPREAGPTGGDPLMAPGRVAAQRAGLAAGDVDLTYALATADRTVTPDPADDAYADFGQWAGWAFAVTGKGKYARAAYRKVRERVGTVRKAKDRNITREETIDYALIARRIRPALSDEEYRTLLGDLNWCCDVALGGEPWGGTRVRDTDELVGHLGGLTLIAYLPGNPWREKLLSDARVAEWRAELPKIVSLAKGGVWMESQKYNLGTLQLLLTFAYADGIGRHPDVAALVPDFLDAQLWDLTPDSKDSYQWGDEENPRDLTLHARVPLLKILTGLARSEAGRAAVGALTAGKPVGSHMLLGWRVLSFYDPPAAAAPPTSRAPEVAKPRYWRYAEGTGHLRFKRDGVLFGAHLGLPLDVDHDFRAVGNFQLYRDGGWSITHPHGYASCLWEPRSMNSALMAGLGSMYDRKALAWGGGDDWCYLTGWTGGPHYKAPHDNPPPPFAEWTRTVVYLHPGVVVVRDKGSVSPPDMTKTWNPRDKELIAGRQFLAAQVFHAHAAPRQKGQAHGWADERGRPVKLHTLTPAHSKVADLSLASDRLAGVGAQESKFWQVQIGTDTPGPMLLVSVLDAAGIEPPVLEGEAVRAAGRLVRFESDGRVRVE